jgi:hypothetical protein
MVFTFYKARGLGVGSSLVEEDQLELAKKLEKIAKEKGVKVCYFHCYFLCIFGVLTAGVVCELPLVWLVSRCGDLALCGAGVVRALPSKESEDVFLGWQVPSNPDTRPPLPTLHQNRQQIGSIGRQQSSKCSSGMDCAQIPTID